MHPDKTHLIFGEFLARGAERRVRWDNGFWDSPVVESGVQKFQSQKILEGRFLILGFGEVVLFSMCAWPTLPIRAHEIQLPFSSIFDII
ncbi:MAG: hypothetical protein COV07_03530 [Candidatus Vogelbacteria bacterium CG10_big_fil_rev_8_21_14_0_10_45_14]|uniref:Uncharacterized protein n=2 Tax=Parcubacteria group TaxID=1794811 RepID=A0A2H0E0R9_9BACT|nr:MAG: hypothetical protein COW81_00300 [Candidatus Campbellbacteria bacterium CG22_combo_CG10-13_8_21_14_all_36_13]PIR46575.1 MAG: hypothetical protein COV07_03530 [Candidatus Vogelbacteria bacterium CG10_big_fil_rev_8_21_14_0_10_45_14]